MEKKNWQILVIIFIFVFLLISSLFAAHIYYNIKYESNDDYWTERFNNLNNEYEELYDSYTECVDYYNTLNGYYEDLQDEYNILLTPLTSIINRTVYWRFKLLDNNIVSWSLNMGTYLYYISESDPTGTQRLKNTNTGETYTVPDLTEYVTLDVFNKIIPDLTTGNSDKEFVAEVVNIKNQLINYSEGLGGEYRWPVETLTEGTGNCGDISILVASLLKAGEEYADYGLKVYLWYCDGGNITDPQDVNHAIVGVEYSDGDCQLIETTVNIFYSYGQIEGWKFEV